MANKAERIYPWLVELRRTLHRIPETAYQEVQTARALMGELERLGIPFRYGGVGGGIIARIAGAQGGPTVALRAEMDALPVSENTGLPFASRIPGCMHACGHDGHMAMVLGAAALLREDPPPGQVVIVLQPAEESGKGAEAMVRAGAMDGVDMIFAGHMTRRYPLGEIMVPRGLVSAQSDRLTLRVRGRGGHGARPHEGSDAVVASAALILGLQTLISRESDAFHPAVLSIGTVRAGTAPNAIAHEAVLDGILRTCDPQVRERLLEGVQRMARATGDAYATRIDVDVFDPYPAVINADLPAAIASRAAVAIVGEEHLHLRESPSMGAEDFSFYLAQAPGCYVRFGARPLGGKDVALHSPEFDFAEPLLALGASFFEAVAREAIAELARGDDLAAQ